MRNSSIPSAAYTTKVTALVAEKRTLEKMPSGSIG